MKKKSILVLLLATTCLLFTGCIKDTYSPAREDTSYQEWISPDGVHYWYMNSGYGKQLAVRYDHDGNVVIDK